MRAGRDFADRLARSGRLGRVARVGCALYGSLGATGLGHGTADAVVAGLRGLDPETCPPDQVRRAWLDWPDGAALALGGAHPVAFARSDIAFEPATRLPGHPNALTLWARDGAGRELAKDTYYSIGGGFIRRQGEQPPPSRPDLPFDYRDGRSLLALCDEAGLTIAELALRNELSLRPANDLIARLDAIWEAMVACVEAGLAAEGPLPGRLGVKRRANAICVQLQAAEEQGRRGPLDEWLGAYALAVNEQNAAGERVVTAPTNGSAGVLPAVALYWSRFLASAGSDPDLEPAKPAADQAIRRGGVRRLLLTATALGSLFKANASISGAEGGCQAEVGSACAMAAGGLAAVLGGSNRQVENAAEIALEHHLGLTCDPIAGLVQIPCIERNAVAASTAVTAARLALRGDGSHRVSLDAGVETMRQTGLDMSTKYKETGLGGLAVNVVEC
jgi:L-serine dehydratase